MQKLYVATEKFSPTDGDGWKKYIDWCGLTQLVEVVGLDGMLNPPVLTLKDTYWRYIVNEDYMLDYFTDLDFLRSELRDRQRINLLGTIRAPSVDVSRMVWDGFSFLGYELLDQDNSISALTNCGGFPESFRNDELSERGLILSFRRAVEIQQDLKRLNPQEHHADTNIWAIFRFDDTEATSPQV
jgi:hypothetical protein